jgi:two-component system sensor histidine kinase EvgS
MDLKMPVMDGIEATVHLKRLYPDVPVIAQTAYSSPEDIQRALDAGCDDVIIKPIFKSKLMEMMYKYGK